MIKDKPGKLNPSAVRDFGETVDFGQTASDYRIFRAGFPKAFFDRLEDDRLIVGGLSALDIGTGTGTVARGLAAKGLAVTGLDPSEALLGEAASLATEAGLQIDFRTGTAENLPFTDASFDIVTAGQCWHWFDRPAVATEIRRVLSPGGRIIIAHFDWLPLAGNVVEATEQLILKLNPDWAPMSGGAGIYPAWLGDLANAGFNNLETFSFDVGQPYSHEAWRGRIRASAGVKASKKAADVEQFDADLGELLAARFAEDPLNVPHRVWAATGTSD